MRPVRNSMTIISLILVLLLYFIVHINILTVRDRLKELDDRIDCRCEEIIDLQSGKADKKTTVSTE